jgi:hypothetical protein
MDGLRCLGRTPGYVRYSGYDTAEEEARYLPVLGPVWKYGDPVPPAARADRLEEKTMLWSTVFGRCSSMQGQVRERQRRSPTAWPI